jgi:hypothetical protein
MALAYASSSLFLVNYTDKLIPPANKCQPETPLAFQFTSSIIIWMIFNSIIFKSKNGA